MGPANESGHLPANQSDVSSALTRQVLPWLYLAAFAAGAPLNGAAAWIFFRVPGDRALAVYLKNMVAADLLMLATFPFRAAAQMGPGGRRLRALTCRYTSALFYLSMYAGIVFTGLIGLERYVKMARPPGRAWGRVLRGAGAARVLASLGWGLLALCALPNAALAGRPAERDAARRCAGPRSPLGVRWQRASTFFSVGLFWLTALLLAFCYSSIARRIYRSYRRVGRGGGEDVRRKSSRSIFCLLAVFLVCFAPYHVCRVADALSQTPGSASGRERRFLLFQAKEAGLFLSAVNVCLDPVVYFLMCRRFRESLLEKLAAGGRDRLSGRRARSRRHLEAAALQGNPTRAAGGEAGEDPKR